eukprot:m.137871 g.137871  ORF g.137871 m.137871 type:complete len:258 (+) comp13987_c0_seq2:6174-6947(+)
MNPSRASRTPARRHPFQCRLIFVGQMADPAHPVIVLHRLHTLGRPVKTHSIHGNRRPNADSVENQNQNLHGFRLAFPECTSESSHSVPIACRGARKVTTGHNHIEVHEIVNFRRHKPWSFEYLRALPRAEQLIGTMPGEGEDEVGPASHDGPHPAIEYLRQWDADRKSWKFKKNRQTWLLKNWVNPYKVPKDDFKILLKYLADVQGTPRARVREAAQAALESTIIDDDSADEPKAALHRIKLKRAGKLLKKVLPEAV